MVPLNKQLGFKFAKLMWEKNGWQCMLRPVRASQSEQTGLFVRGSLNRQKIMGFFVVKG